MYGPKKIHLFHIFKVLFQYKLIYLSGLNELACPFYIVYLSSVFGLLSDHREEFQNNAKFKNSYSRYLPAVEADVFYSLSELIDGLKRVHPFDKGSLHGQVMVSLLERLAEKVNFLIPEKLIVLGKPNSGNSFEKSGN